MSDDGDASKPMSRGQAVSVGVVAGFVAVVAYIGYLIFGLFAVLASIPSGCGFNADDSCTNPDANNTTLAVVLIVGYVVFFAVMTWLERGLLRRYLRQMGLWLTPAHLLGFAGSLVLLPGLALVAMWVGSSTLTSQVLAAGATALVIAIGTWTHLLRSAARPGGQPL